MTGHDAFILSLGLCLGAFGMWLHEALAPYLADKLADWRIYRLGRRMERERQEQERKLPAATVRQLRTLENRRQRIAWTGDDAA